MSQGEWDEARKEAHGIKGVAGNVGADAIFHAAQNVEKNIKMDNVQMAKEALPGLNSAIQETLKDLETLNQNSNALEADNDKAEFTDEEISIVLQELDDLLSQFDMQAMQYLENKKNILQHIFNDTYEDLEAATNSLDFDKAREFLSKAGK